MTPPTPTPKAPEVHGNGFHVRSHGATEGTTRYTIEQPLNVLHEKEKTALNRLHREVAWPGFRKGGVPLEKFRARHGGQAREQALTAMVKESVARAMDEERILSLTPPVVESVDVSREVVRIKFAVECPPDVDVTGYKGLRLTRRRAPVPSEAVDKTMKDIGAESAGAPADFREVVKKLLESEADRLVRRDLESQAVEALLEAHPFDVPPSLTKEREERLFFRLKAQHRAKGGTEEGWKDRREEYAPTVRQEAERGVRLAYILAAIAEGEGLAVTNEEAVVAVRKAVRQLPEDHRQRSIAKLEAQKEDVRALMLEDKVFDFIIKNAVIVDEPYSEGR